MNSQFSYAEAREAGWCPQNQAFLNYMKGKGHGLCCGVSTFVAIVPHDHRWFRGNGDRWLRVP
jgi:hypothetical protein